MRTRKPFRHLASTSLLTLSLALPLAQPAHGAQHGPAECKVLFDLYLTCYETGINADSSLTCLAACSDRMVRTTQRLSTAPAPGKKPRKDDAGAQAITELICSTGCEDATTALVRATQQEFTEAFCD